MKRLIVFILTFGLGTTIFSQNSHIQVISEPGISVYIDESFKGVTQSEIGGLIIQNISPGNHSIKVVKEGYIPQIENIYLKTGEVFTYQVNKNFVPKIKISEQGNKEDQSLSIKKGSLKIQSLPININVYIPSLQINQSKQKDEWLAEQIPEGTYKANYTWNNKVLEDNVTIKNEMITYVFVNMIEGKIQQRSYIPINSPGPVTEPVKQEVKENDSSNEVLSTIGCLALTFLGLYLLGVFDE